MELVFRMIYQGTFLNHTLQTGDKEHRIGEDSSYGVRVLCASSQIHTKSRFSRVELRLAWEEIIIGLISVTVSHYIANHCESA